jgi:choline kinase
MVKAIIIAAGLGKRLLPLTSMQPKPLIQIGDKPLIHHVLNTLRKAGVKNCIIVTGYMEQAFRKYIGNGARFNMRIQCCYNPFYNKGNAISLKTAEKLLDKNEKFLLTMADHLVSEEMIRKAVKNMHHAPLLCVDKQPDKLSRIDEATKVLVDTQGYVRNIGKNIKLWNAVDTGVFLFTYRIFEIINLMKPKHPFLTITQCVKKMINVGVPLWACDVSGNFWMDIDTWDDIVLAEQVLRSS